MEILATTAAAGGAPGATSEGKFASDYDAFLKLLTTQLKNQDPLSPLDATQFVTQLSQFAMVEQAILTNQRLDALLQSSRNAVLSADIGLIGHRVEVPGKTIDLAGGRAEFGYSMSRDAESAAVSIRDSAGNLVRNLALDPKLGSHNVIWDGLDDAGSPVAEGDYKLEFSVFDADGKPIPVTGYIAAKVERVELDPSGSMLLLSNGERVPAGAVRAILGA
jgi:flagellar basal-body rod modification protein FlgD